MKVSVIMPVYNGSKYLRQCMDSIVCQTLEDIEIICVNDGSTDNSLEILEEYAQKDSRVKIICQENRGASAARNNGLRHAMGEYLSILDSDDFFEPEMLEKSYLRAKETDADIVVFRCDLYDEQTGLYRSGDHVILWNLLPEKDVFALPDVRRSVFNLFCGWSWDKLFRRSFVEENDIWFQEQRSTNDMLFVFAGLLRAKRITVMRDLFAHYRQSEGSLSRTREKSWWCFYTALMALREELYTLGLYERYERDFKNFCLALTHWHLETLKEPTHTLLYNKLREEWFAEMGVLNHPRKYFYSVYQYHCFRNIYEYPIEFWKEQSLTFKTAVDASAPAVLERNARDALAAKAEKKSAPRKKADMAQRITALKRHGIKYALRRIVEKIRF